MQSMRCVRGCSPQACQSAENGHGSDRECRRLKKKLQEIDFAIADTVLYLDAYPDCEMALAYYRKLIEQREQYWKSVNEICGPLCHTQNGNRESWQWTQGPWPWQAEANGKEK